MPDDATDYNSQGNPETEPRPTGENGSEFDPVDNDSHSPTPEMGAPHEIHGSPEITSAVESYEDALARISAIEDFKEKIAAIANLPERVRNSMAWDLARQDFEKSYPRGHWDKEEIIATMMRDLQARIGRRVDLMEAGENGERIAKDVFALLAEASSIPGLSEGVIWKTGPSNKNDLSLKIREDEHSEGDSGRITTLLLDELGRDYKGRAFSEESFSIRLTNDGSGNPTTIEFYTSNSTGNARHCRATINYVDGNPILDVEHVQANIPVMTGRRSNDITPYGRESATISRPGMAKEVATITLKQISNAMTSYKER